MARQTSQTSIGGQALDQVSSDRRPATSVPIEGASPLKRMRFVVFTYSLLNKIQVGNLFNINTK